MVTQHSAENGNPALSRAEKDLSGEKEASTVQIDSPTATSLE